MPIGYIVYKILIYIYNNRNDEARKKYLEQKEKKQKLNKAQYEKNYKKRLDNIKDIPLVLYSGLSSISPNTQVEVNIINNDLVINNKNYKYHKEFHITLPIKRIINVRIEDVNVKEVHTYSNVKVAESITIDYKNNNGQILNLIFESDDRIMKYKGKSCKLLKKKIENHPDYKQTTKFIKL